jgi:hypothetical protein
MARPLAPSGRPATRAPQGQLGGLTGALVRPQGQRVHRPTGYVSPQALVRQRRQNVVVGLAITVVVTLFLAFTTGSQAFVMLFGASLIALVVYCYVLVQLRVRRDNERYYNQFRRR